MPTRINKTWGRGSFIPSQKSTGSQTQAAINTIKSYDPKPYNPDEVSTNEYIVGSIPYLGTAMDISELKRALDNNDPEAAVVAAVMLGLPAGLDLIGRKFKPQIKLAARYLGNSLEDYLPKISRILHTYNIKDNIKHMTPDELLDNFVDRLKYRGYDINIEKTRKDILDGKNWRYSPSSEIGVEDNILLNGEIVPIIDLITPNEKTWLHNLNSVKEKYTGGKNSLAQGKDLRNSGGGAGIGITVGDMLDGEKVSPFQWGLARNHELKHYMAGGNPYTFKQMKKSFLQDVDTPVELLTDNPRDYSKVYFTKLGGDEFLARFTQILDLNGIKGGDRMSKSMLDATMHVLENPKKYKLFDNNLSKGTWEVVTNPDSPYYNQRYYFQGLTHYIDQNRMENFRRFLNNQPGI